MTTDMIAYLAVGLMAAGFMALKHFMFKD